MNRIPTPQSHRRPSLRAAGCVLLAALGCASTATGQIWNKTTDGAWRVAGNWITPMMVPDANAQVTFPDILTGRPATIRIGKAYTVNSLTFDSTKPYTLQATNAAALLTFGRKGGQAAPEITVNGTNTAANVIAVPLAITSGRTLTVFNQGSAQLTISGAISGDKTTQLDFVNAGQTYLTGTNTYSGLTYVNGGNLAINGDAALGAAGTAVRLRAGGMLTGLGPNVTVAAGRVIRLFNDPNAGAQAVDGILSGDPNTPSNILKVDAQIVNDAANKGQAGRLEILNSVQLTNTNNMFGGANTPIYIGNSTTSGTLYLSSDKVLGNPGNYLDVNMGGIVALATFDSSRRIVSELSTSIDVANKTDTLTWNGVISGGRIVKTGPGTLTLTATNTYSRTRIEGGIVSVSQDTNLGKPGGTLSISNGAELAVTKTFASDRKLTIGINNSARINVSSGATWTENGVVGGGTLIKVGEGVLKLTSNNNQSMTSIVNGKVSVSDDGQLGKMGAPVQLSYAGQLLVTKSFTTNRSFTLGQGNFQGINVENGQKLTITSGVTETMGTQGSFTKYGDGTLQFAKGSNSQVFGSTTVKAGTFQVDGVYNASNPPGGGIRNANGTVIGTGTIMGTFNNEKKVAAGDNAPGMLTVLGHTVMAAGSSFGFNINSAIGQAGGTVGWGLLDVQGSMDLLGTHVVDLDTLTLANAPGPIASGLWDPNQNYLWLFADASNGITGFNPSEFTVDTTGFLSPIAPGRGFEVEQIGNGLYIAYLATGMSTVPEPPSWILGVTALSLLALAHLTRARVGCRASSPLPTPRPPR